MPGQFTISGASPGEPEGARTFGPITLTGALAIGESLALTLASGDNTIAIPPGATICWLVPPLLNAVALKLRTSANAGDAGLPISPNEAFGPFPFAVAAPTTLIVNAASLTTGLTVVVFI